MLNLQPGPERAKLGFKEAVLSSFKFLTEVGLHLVDEKVTFVRYESSEVFINIYHGRASYEMNVEVGRLRDPKRYVTLATILDWAGAYKSEGFGQHVMFQVGTREGVQEFVPRLAALVKKYAASLLRNDEADWTTVLQLQSLKWRDYIKTVNLRQLREKAEAAWHAKDYVRVVELYEPVRQDLTQVEAKKLAYAQHQVLTTEDVGMRSARKRR